MTYAVNHNGGVCKVSDLRNYDFATCGSPYKLMQVSHIVGIVFFNPLIYIVPLNHKDESKHSNLLILLTCIGL